MFEYLQAEAYTRLIEEIRSAIIAALDNDDPEMTEFRSGRMVAYSQILAIMNSVHRDLIEDLDHEAEKESAYYESELSADESRSKQL